MPRRKGIPCSPEHRAKLSIAAKSRRFSAETRAKISTTLMGHLVSAETRAKISAANKRFRTPMKQQLWDDAAFIQRVKAAAERKGITVNEALKAAGLSSSYLKKQVVGRMTNKVFNLARVLDVPAIEMCGIAVEAPPVTARPNRSGRGKIDSVRTFQQR